MTREEAIRILKHFSLCGAYHELIHMNDTDSEAITMAIKALEQPEVIRCKDCKWRNVYQFSPKYDERDYCDKHEKTVGADGFCSWAERREE